MGGLWAFGGFGLFEAQPRVHSRESTGKNTHTHEQDHSAKMQPLGGKTHLYRASHGGGDRAR